MTQYVSTTSMPYDGAVKLIACALELLCEIEDTHEAMLTDAVIQDAARLRSVVTEWVDIETSEL